METVNVLSEMTQETGNNPCSSLPLQSGEEDFADLLAEKQNGDEHCVQAKLKEIHGWRKNRAPSHIKPFTISISSAVL